MIENKWKRFAMSQVLSDWSTQLDSAELFDLINETPDESLKELFDNNQIIIWQQFDNMELRDVASQVFELASFAQEVANSD